MASVSVAEQLDGVDSVPTVLVKLVMKEKGEEGLAIG